MLDNLRKNFTASVLAGAAFALNNPAGHSLTNELGLRIAYAGELESARQALNLPNMDFDQFKKLAPIALTIVYDGDSLKIAKAVQDLGGNNPFCLPFNTGQQDKENPEPTSFACHAVCSRKDKEKNGFTLKL